jgi:hypothetical protein
MRRILTVTTIALAATCLLPWPAQSKGLEEHAKVAIRGPGLAEPIRLNGEDAFLFVERSGAFQAKWDVPNLGGDLTPNAELGTAYRAAVRMRCWNGNVVSQVHTDAVPGGSGRTAGLYPCRRGAVLRVGSRVLAGFGRAPLAAPDERIAREHR